MTTSMTASFDLCSHKKARLYSSRHAISFQKCPLARINSRHRRHVRERLRGAWLPDNLGEDMRTAASKTFISASSSREEIVVMSEELFRSIIEPEITRTAEIQTGLRHNAVSVAEGGSSEVVGRVLLLCYFDLRLHQKSYIMNPFRPGRP